MENQNKKNSSLTPAHPHDLSLHERKNIHITGVIDVTSATPTLVTLKTTGGPLSIHGSEMKIKNLNNSQQEVDIEGNINELKYEASKKNIFKKIFK